MSGRGVDRSAASRRRTALVLSGGGARGAYQVGVLAGMLEQGLLSSNGVPPFDVYVGASAGAINAAALAAQADRFTRAVDQLRVVWSTMRPDSVFRTDFRSLGRIGTQWVRDLSFGGLLRHVAPKSLLDNRPLRQLLKREIPFARIQHNVRQGLLHALAVPATDLISARGVVFLQGRSEIRPWQRGRWRVEPTHVHVDHLMASSAIPLFFPSVEIGGRHFGDGCIRNTAPLSPGLNLGAERIVAIGVRQRDLPEGDRPVEARAPPTIAEIAGTLFAVMLDAIELDVEHSERVNRSVLRCRTDDPDNPFRWVDVLWLSPSRDVVALAGELASRLPRLVRYLIRGLGSDEATAQLTSYLLFDAEYCSRLIDLGRSDVRAQADEIRAFFVGDPNRETASSAALRR